MVTSGHKFVLGLFKPHLNKSLGHPKPLAGSLVEIWVILVTGGHRFVLGLFNPHLNKSLGHPKPLAGSLVENRLPVVMDLFGG